MVCVTVEALQSFFGLKTGTHAFRVLSRLRGEAYVASTVYWIITMGREAPKENEMPEQLRFQLLALQQRATSLIALFTTRTGA